MANRKRKDYAPWNSPHHRQLNRNVEKIFGDGSGGDPNCLEWVIAIILILFLGLLVAFLKKH